MMKKQNSEITCPYKSANVNRSPQQLQSFSTPPIRQIVKHGLACSAGDKPAGAKVRRPVVRIAGWRETKTLKPIDEVSFRGDYESPGRNESKRRSGLESD